MIERNCEGFPTGEPEVELGAIVVFLTLPNNNIGGVALFSDERMDKFENEISELPGWKLTEGVLINGMYAFTFYVDDWPDPQVLVKRIDAIWHKHAKYKKAFDRKVDWY